MTERSKNRSQESSENGAAGSGSDAASPPPEGIHRRDFLRVSGTLAATSAMAVAGCRAPVEVTIPFHERPESLALGKPRIYATVHDGVPVRVKTREGRPILVMGNPGSPSRRALTVRTHASVLDLYDADRAQGPLSVRRGDGAPVDSDWGQVGREVVQRLSAGKRDVALLTGPISGPATQAAIDDLVKHAGVRHVAWSPLQADAAAAAWQAAFGGGVQPRPRLDRADLIVGFGAEFIDEPSGGLERDFGARRAPVAAAGGLAMSRFVQLESRLTLTGANADRRVRVRDSQLANVAAAVAHEVVVAQKVGPLAGNAAVAAALGPYAPDAVARMAGVDAGVIRGLASELIRAKGRAVVLAGGSASAGARGEALELAVLVLNHSLGNYDGPAFDAQAADAIGRGGAAALAALAADMSAGKVGTLIVAGANPVYDAPGAIGFAAAMSKVARVVSLNDRVDETSALADTLAPASHPFEAWGDVDLGGGVLAIQQPAIRPLYDTHGLLDVLVAWGAAAGVPGRMAQAAAAAAPAAVGAPPTSAGYHYLRAFWGERILGKAPGTPGFEDAWDGVLRAGGWEGPKPAVQAAFRAAAVAGLGAPTPVPGELEVQLYPHLAVHDGRAANNGWLQEMPDPITRITWGGAVSIAPRRFDAMGLKNGDLVTVAAGGAGMHNDQVAIPLGLGRTRPGRVGADTGVNAYPLAQMAGGRILRSGLAATLTRAEGHATLAITQGADVLDRDRRPLLPTAALSELRKDPKAGTEQPEGGKSAWPEFQYPGAKWAMAIDLSKCTGCGKCTISCQSENNIPVVGHKGVVEGREMSWIRIDRYYDAPKKEGRWDDSVWDGPLGVVEEPTTLFEPMLCQHCENAPCETVCPFVATMHSEDGLNEQIYNRCVGTRYCANNCPFKVRRYNWFEYSHPKTGWLARLMKPELERHADLNTRGRTQMKNNPEVTVRSRGVMEKCSFCVQRIREARAEAGRAGEDKQKLPDGAVVTACMEACPTQAIVFGDGNDPTSRVAALVKDSRSMRLLEATGVKPAISYLTRVRNDDA